MKIGRIISAILIAFCAFALTGPFASAAGSVPGMGKRVYKSVIQAQEYMDGEAYNDALGTLKKLLERKLSSYERAVVLNMTAYIYYQKDDLPKALEGYTAGLSQPRLPDSMIRSMLTTISQLYLVTGDYIKAEEYARKLLDALSGKPIPPASHVILAQALIGQERFNDALAPLLNAINQQRAEGHKIQERWLALLGSIYFSLEDFPAMREVLYELISVNAKPQYLMNLAAIHGQLGDTNKQLALMESLKDDKKLSSGQHLLNLANLFMVHELPFKAASLLQKEMRDGRIEKNQRNLQLQSQAWYLAGEFEKALPPLKEAAELSDDGEMWLRIARLYVSLYDWPKAEKAAQAAVKAGNLKKSGSGLILEGMALARQSKFNQAKKILRRAGKHKESEKYAKQWLAFVESEQSRLEKLK